MVAGANHFVRPDFYVAIMPAWVPWPMQMVYVSGACEIFGALLLLHPKTQRAGAWFVIILLIAIFPANIQMAINFSRAHNPYLWAAIARLPLQVILIWWAWVYSQREPERGKGR